MYTSSKRVFTYVFCFQNVPSLIPAPSLKKWTEFFLIKVIYERNCEIIQICFSNRYLICVRYSVQRKRLSVQHNSCKFRDIICSVDENKSWCKNVIIIIDLHVYFLTKRVVCTYVPKCPFKSKNLKPSCATCSCT